MIGNIGKFAQLLAGQHAIGNGDSQHRCKALNIQAVLQSQGQELCGRQFAAQESRCLVAKLGNAIGKHLVVVFVVLIHDSGVLCFLGSLELSSGPKRCGRQL